MTSARGVTLLEVVIAIAIIAAVSIGMYASSVYTARQNEDNLEREYAVQILEMGVAKARVADFTKIADTTLTSTAYENQFNSSTNVNVDSLSPDFPTYKLAYKFTGWGTVNSASAGNLTADFPANVSKWEPNEWTGHFVVVATGSGGNQMMRITKNTAQKLTVTNKLGSGSSSTWLSGTPTSGAEFYIDNGKFVDVTVSWTSRQGITENLSERVLVPRPI